MMFARRSHTQTESFGKYRASKSVGKSKRSSFKDPSSRSRVERAAKKAEQQQQQQAPTSPSDTINSPVVTIVVGPEARLFACHESVLAHSPYFAAICRGQYLESNTKRIDLPEEAPEVLSSVLEYLYKGDYSPRLAFDKKRNTWELEDDGAPKSELTVFHPTSGTCVLKDTAIYCSADRYGLEELKRLALRKQGLQSGIQCSTILSSARFAYANTDDNDSKLRAHYLALIIRSRSTFKRSGTMQMEMIAGGKMFFDLFVALVNHLDDVASIKSPR